LRTFASVPVATHGGYARSPYLAARESSDRILCTLLCAYLATFVFEGPLRYALVIAGAPSVLYLRDLIPAGSLAFLFFRALLFDEWVDGSIAVPAVLLVLHTAIAVFLGTALIQIVFGFKLFLPIVYGMAVWPLIRERFDGALKVAAAMFFVTVSGVALNYLWGRFPWEGLEYDTAFGSVAATREWTMLGDVRRLPGFTRVSYGAAMILGITGALTMLRLRNAASRALIAALTLLAVAATTTKGMILAFLLVIGWQLLGGERRHWLGHGMVLGSAALTLLLPGLVVLFDLGGGTPPSGLPAFLTSVWDRFVNTWPGAVELLPEGPVAMLGAGLGSIGTPEAASSGARLFSSADNLALFLFVSFGLLGMAYYALPALATARLASTETLPIRASYTALLLLTYGFGVSTNMVGDAVFGIAIGFCLRLAVASLSAPPVLEGDLRA